MKTRVLLLVVAILAGALVVGIWQSRAPAHGQRETKAATRPVAEPPPQVKAQVPLIASSNVTEHGVAVSPKPSTSETVTTPRQTSGNEATTSSFASSNAPEHTSLLHGTKCYKQIGRRLVLGAIDEEGMFIADVPEKAIDLEKSTPISLRYPILPGSDQSATIVTNSRGQLVRVRFDAKTGRIQYEMQTP